jgi:hypothetical protein
VPDPIVLSSNPQKWNGENVIGIKESDSMRRKTVTGGSGNAIEPVLLTVEEGSSRRREHQLILALSLYFADVYVHSLHMLRLGVVVIFGSGGRIMFVIY